MNIKKRNRNKIFFMTSIFFFMNIQILYADVYKIGPFEITVVKIESLLDKYSEITLQIKNISTTYIRSCILTCVLKKDGTILDFQKQFVNNLAPGNDTLTKYLIKIPKSNWNQIGFRINTTQCLSR